MLVAGGTNHVFLARLEDPTAAVFILFVFPHWLDAVLEETVVASRRKLRG